MTKTIMKFDGFILPIQTIMKFGWYIPTTKTITKFDWYIPILKPLWNLIGIFSPPNHYEIWLVYFSIFIGHHCSKFRN